MQVAAAGALVSVRQILLHIKPGDPGYGEPVLGMHLYTWALITFYVVILFVAVVSMLAPVGSPRRRRRPGAQQRTISTLIVGLFVLVVAANVIAIIFLERFRWVSPTTRQATTCSTSSVYRPTSAGRAARNRRRPAVDGRGRGRRYEYAGGCVSSAVTSPMDRRSQYVRPWPCRCYTGGVRADDPELVLGRTGRGQQTLHLVMRTCGTPSG
ncbi:MAG: hypothetical protein R2687_03150 [Candidatus Nanopelagicales bacterium]